MEQSATSLYTTLNATRHGILAVYQTGEIPFVNQALIEMWGIPEEIVALSDHDALLTYIISKLQEPAVFLAKIQKIESESTLEVVDLFGKVDNRSFEVFSQPLWLNQEIIGRIWHFYDVTEKIQTENIWRQQVETLKEELSRLNLVDSLTQIANRRRFEQYLEQEWQRLARDQQPLSLIVCDLDYFNLYNDAYGYLEGDNCLQQLAWALSLALNRPADLVARIDGDEFALILPNTNLNGGIFIAEKIRQHLQSLNIIHPNSPINQLVTVSCGIASLIPRLELLPTDLIIAADKALYQAKAKGGDCIIVSSQK